MGKVKSGARKPPAKPKQRRKRQIDAEHETGSPSEVDKRHAFLTAISRSVHEASLLIFSRLTTAKVAELLPASSISDSERLSLKQGTGNGGMGNGEWGTGNGERGISKRGNL